MKYILSIDQGTTGSRTILYDAEGRATASSYREFPQYFPKPGWVEHDPEEIWDSVNTSIQAVLGQLPDAEIAAIGITNQRETTIVWDRNTGRPVCNAIVWQCRRTAGRCSILKKKPGMADSVRQKTGLPIDAYFSASKIEWTLENVDGLRERSNKGELLFGTTDSWILWKLTGGEVHATDFTNASRTMLFDINELKWDDELLDLFGIPARMLPVVKRSSGNFGVTVEIGRMSAGIPITGIAGDQQAALFSHACFAPGSIKNTYGTGCFILMNSGADKPTSEHGLITTLGCGREGEPVYVLEGAVFTAGAAIQWLRDGLGILGSAEESVEKAMSVEDNGGVYFVPALTGLGAPYWDPDARGLITGITRGTETGHIVRAALEAICYQTKDVLDVMEKDTGLCIDNLNVDGGAAANDYLCQFQADILGIDVTRPKVLEITSLGAAYLAGLAVGYWKSFQNIEECLEVDRIFTPSMPKQDADKLYEGWKRAVKRTL